MIVAEIEAVSVQYCLDGREVGKGGRGSGCSHTEQK